MDEEIDILALLSNAVTHSPWYLSLPFVEAGAIPCNPIRVDPRERAVNMLTVGAVPFTPGEVVGVSFETGGTRYSFYASVKQPSGKDHTEGSFAVGLPATLKAEANRSSMRYRPPMGEVELTFESPFGGATRAGVVDITSRGAGFLVHEGDCVCPIGTHLDKVTMHFRDGAA